MKLEQKKRACELRRRGESITVIAASLGVSKGSVSAWVRDIALSQEVRQKIKTRSHSTVVVEKRRSSRLHAETKKRQQYVAAAAAEIGKISQSTLRLIGVSLYWGEGSKRKKGVLEFTNSDPVMIRVMMRFFTEIQGVPSGKFRGHVYIHDHIQPVVAERYWSKVSGIKRTQFHKTSIQKNKKKLQKDTLPYGTFAIVVCDTKKKLQMDGWIIGLGKRAEK